MKRDAPATHRNRDPIAQVLTRFLPRDPGLVLEIASGSGQHGAYFAGLFPHLIWQPSDMDPDNLASIQAWRDDVGHPNLRPPVWLDVRQDWPISQARALFCANMIHIAPFDCTRALMDGAGRVLGPDGLLIVYGPFRVNGAHTAPSNQAFDQDLRARNPQWGVRDLEEVGGLAQAAGLDHLETVFMPANNLCVVWRRRP